jgi:P4 family phage/plasmid primase-like protien
MNNTSAIEMIPGVTVVDTNSEYELANLLQQRIGPVMTVGKSWRQYHDGVWQEIARDLLRPTAQEVLPRPKRTERRANQLLDHLEGRLQRDPETLRGFHRLDSDGNVLINAANGIVRVTRAGAIDLLPHDPAHLFTQQTAAAYHPEATAPLFESLLVQSIPDPEDRQMLQLFAGNVLLPSCQYEAALVCYGEGGSGKSTIASGVTAALGENLVTSVTLSQICDPKSYHLPKLRFAAVNLGTELDAVPMEDSANFKLMVSGEPIEAREIYGSPFRMQTTAKLWFLANELPRFKHGSGAERRRLRFLHFAQMPATEDVTLRSRVPAERDGIFSWMLHGLRDLLSLAKLPLGGAASRDVHARFGTSNDPLGVFIASECVLAPECITSMERLRDRFKDYAADHGLDFGPDAGQWFSRRLFQRYPQLKPTRSRISGEVTRCVMGLKLKPGSICRPMTIPIEAVSLVNSISVPLSKF